MHVAMRPLRREAHRHRGPAARTKCHRVPGCGRRIVLKATGRTPKWCSATCRHRAWEQDRAVQSGLVAVTVVDRAIEVEVPVQVVRTVEVKVPRMPRGSEWVQALHELARQLDGGSVYNRDLPALRSATNIVIDSLTRRRRF